jgi:membrane protein
MAFHHKIGDRIVSSAPARTIIRGSKAVYIPGFKGYSLFEVWPIFLKRLRRTSLFERAAAISFNVFMAIPPTLIFIFTLIPYMPISDKFLHELFGLIRDIVPGEKNNSIIIDFLNDFLTKPRNELLSFGLLLAIIFSSNAMMGVMRSFDKNYPGFKKRGSIRKRQTALLLTLIIFVLVFGLILLLVAQSVVLEALGVEIDWVRYTISNFRWVLIALLILYMVSFIYRYAPALIIRWPYTTPGSIFATTLMIIATLSVSFWVNHFNNYNQVYGSISAVFILMLLIYANSLALLIGFELNVTITNLTRKTAEKNEQVLEGDERLKENSNGT